MNKKILLRNKRKARIRVRVRGTHERPRLAVHRSNTRLSVQVIDDEKRETLLAKIMKGTSQQAAKLLGTEIVTLCKEKHITRLVFDRGGFRYHGAIKEIADSVREGGVTI